MKSEIAPGTLAGQLETILVVDDNESVLSVVVALLKRANFQVLSADNGANAIELAKEDGRAESTCSFPTWTCPSMSGPDFGETLKKARPNMHVMLMSGGSDGNLLVLNYGWAFIQKPFVSTKLVQMVTERIALTRPVTTWRSGI